MLIHISTKATIKQGTIMIGDQYSFAGLAATSLKLKNNIYFASDYTNRCFSNIVSYNLD